jgi:methyl-accepting chemotaxis protein
VVGAEVKNLANQTGKATEEISVQIIHIWSTAANLGRRSVEAGEWTRLGDEHVAASLSGRFTQ